jgi:MFS family permease
MFFGFYTTILTIVLKESPQFYATEETLGLMQTTIQIVTVAAQYFSGLILDRIGSVKLIIVGFALDSVGYLGYLVAGDIAHMWLLRVLIGALSPFYNVGMMVALMELVDRPIKKKPPAKKKKMPAATKNITSDSTAIIGFLPG